MRVFKGKMPERDPMELVAMAMHEGASYGEHPELDRLCRRLARNGVDHEHGETGPWSGLQFDSPHGRVSVMYGPGTIGSDRGLLEAYCKGWDMSPRGSLTADAVYETYMHGGWS